MLKKLAIGSDHAGFDLKEVIKNSLQSQGYEVQDFGTHSADSTDYPDYAHDLSTSVERGDCELGVLICGSANGVCMTANKHQDIRAAIAWNKELAELARGHNNANVLCLPSRFISQETAKEIVEGFLSAQFEGGRHERRVNKIAIQ
ncbi:MAG: ribose 5-phosphate isomerase B [Flavobacteriales bacterium]|nr:ribose 5-phosphate isomerase B [Flavobacteriales bacterium]